MYPGQQSPTVTELLEPLIELYQAIPLLVWVLAILLVLGLGPTVIRYLSGMNEPPGDDTIDRRTSETRVTREAYSIHENVETRDRDYREPSEYDEISEPNAVDRGILGTIRRLVRLVSSGGRERE